MLSTVAIDEDEDVLPLVRCKLNSTRMIPRVINRIIAGSLGGPFPAGLPHIQNSVERGARSRRAVDTVISSGEAMGDLRRCSRRRAARIFVIETIRGAALDAAYALVRHDRTGGAAARYAFSPTIDVDLGAISYAIITGWRRTDLIRADLALAIITVLASLSRRTRITIATAIKAGFLSIAHPIVTARCLAQPPITHPTQAIALNLTTASRSTRGALASAVHIGLNAIAQAIVAGSGCARAGPTDLRAAIEGTITGLTISTGRATSTAVDIGLRPSTNLVITRGGNTGSHLTDRAHAVVGPPTQTSGETWRTGIATTIDIRLGSIATPSPRAAGWHTIQAVLGETIPILCTSGTVSAWLTITTAIKVGLGSVSHAIITVGRRTMCVNTPLIQAVRIVRTVSAVNAGVTQAPTIDVRFDPIQDTIIAGWGLTQAPLADLAEAISRQATS